MGKKKPLSPKQLAEIEQIKLHPDVPVTRAAYARYADISQPRIAALVKEGTLQLTSDKLIIPRQADLAREAKNPMQNGSRNDPEEKNADVARRRKAQADKEEAQAETAQMKLLELQGQLVNREAVDTWVYSATQAATKSFEHLPKNLATKISRTDDAHEIQQMLSDAIREILTELSRQLNKQ